MENASTDPESPDERSLVELSPKHRKLTFTLACLAGFSGAHRFYVGRPLTGLAMLLSGGGLLMWWFMDVFWLLSGQFKDGQGRPLGRPRHVDDI